jgi:hypothetical protein
MVPILLRQFSHSPLGRTLRNPCSTPTRLLRSGEAKQPRRGHALVSITLLVKRVRSLI